MLQKLRQRVEFNTLDQQMIFKNRDGIPSLVQIFGIDMIFTLIF
ncbi:hypothetical protein [Mesomycoplasma ovipneumoniae]|nr:hypothetical protein [Mesomycoplasma ovipneumoniae]WNM16942.1 hypothetical protein RNM19_03845 [Mesomycoplasma ovipneumoniae]WNM16943.1 hypothetical protein RNM19_00715 [Mesomycoplasma ovipneumoniae]